MSLQDINFQTERIENVFIMRVQGSINSFTIKRFVDEVKACNKKYPVILDLEEVVLVSSVGIRALREVSDFSYSSGNKIILLNPSPTIKQVFNMAGVKNLFNVAANEELAMKLALKSGRGA